MAVTDAKRRANAKYDGKAYKKVLLRLRNGSGTDRDEVQAAADAQGESLNGYITEAIRRRMESETTK